jgi:hypothetical protein
MGVYRRSDNGRKSKVWSMSYFKDGRQHRESTGSPNKRVAKQVLALRKAQVLEDRWNLPRSRSPRLGRWMEDFLKSVALEKTRSRYRSSINNILAYFGETEQSRFHHDLRSSVLDLILRAVLESLI